MKWTWLFLSTVQQQRAALSKENLSGFSTVGDVTDDKMSKRPRFTAAPKFAFDVFTALLKYNSQSPLTQET